MVVLMRDGADIDRLVRYTGPEIMSRRQGARRYALHANRHPPGDYLEMIGAAIEVAMCRKAERSSSPVVVL